MHFYYSFSVISLTFITRISQHIPEAYVHTTRQSTITNGKSKFFWGNMVRTDCMFLCMFIIQIQFYVQFIFSIPLYCSEMVSLFLSFRINILKKTNINPSAQNAQQNKFTNYGFGASFYEHTPLTWCSYQHFRFGFFFLLPRYALQLIASFETIHYCVKNNIFLRVDGVWGFGMNVCSAETILRMYLHTDVPKKEEIFRFLVDTGMLFEY